MFLTSRHGCHKQEKKISKKSHAYEIYEYIFFFYTQTFDLHCTAGLMRKESVSRNTLISMSW